MVPYVDAVVEITAMIVQLFVLHVCMLRECESVMVTTMLVGGRGRSVGHACVGVTRGSGIVSNAADVLGMSMVSGMK